MLQVVELPLQGYEFLNSLDRTLGIQSGVNLISDKLKYSEKVRQS